MWQYLIGIYIYIFLVLKNYDTWDFVRLPCVLLDPRLCFL
jgi:hypothetical protein